MAAAIAVVALAGCGADEEPAGGARSETAPQSGPAETAPAPTATAPSATAPPDDAVPPAATGSGAEPPRAESPEGRPGGAGDEVPARSQALVTGRGGRVGPRQVQVPPFIAIRVELRSADGARYVLRGGGRTLTVGGNVLARASVFPGLRPSRRLVLRGPQGSVAVVPSAEPGP